jgi:hypothetical protein
MLDDIVLMLDDIVLMLDDIVLMRGDIVLMLDDIVLARFRDFREKLVILKLLINQYHCNKSANVFW